tara:strand:+ start:689 stop:3268 length:2580 start_codon:yes stop_codon:yes gene_type:complete
MDFFNELLESFSRKHSRKLTLLEQESDPRVDQASQMVADALTQGQVRGNSTVAQIQTFNSGPKNLSLTANGSLKIGYPTASWDAQNQKIIPGSDPKQFKQIISMLVGAELTPDEEKRKEKITQKTERSPEEAEAILRDKRREQILKSSMAVNNFEDVAKIIDNVATFEQKINELLCNEGQIDLDYLEAVRNDIKTYDTNTSFWAECGNHTQFLTGNQIGNVERQLVSNAPTLRYEGESGDWVVGSSEQDPIASIEVSRLLNVLADAADGDEESKEEACGRFKVTEGGGLKAVTVYTELGENGRGMSGRVFNNEASARSLKGLMSMAGCSMEAQSARKATVLGSVGAESAIRGEMGEVAKIAVVDVLNIGRGRGQGQGDSEELEERRSLAVDSIKNVYAQMRKLSEERESWLEKAQGAVVSEEEQAQIEMLSRITEVPEKFILAMFSTAVTTAKVRQPLLAVQVAEQTGSGEKQDVLECWASRDKALKALRKSEEFEVDGETRSRLSEDSVVEATVEDIFKNKPDLLERYIKAGVVKPGQSLFVSEISLKTLLSLSSAKKGETTRNSVSKSLSDPTASDPRASNFFNQFDPAGNIKPSDVRGVQEVADKISDAVESLSAKVKIGNITENSVKMYATALLKNLQKNRTFKELNEDDYRTLEEDIKKFAEGKDADKNFVKKVKEKLFKMTLFNNLTLKAQGQDSRTGRPNKTSRVAAMYALAVLNQAGGSARNGTVFQVDALDELASYISTQNGEMLSVLDSIQANDGKWEFDPSQGSLTFKRSDDPNRTISVTLKGGKWIAYRSATSLRNASTRKSSKDANNQLSGGEESKKESATVIDVLSKLTEALGIIKEKVRIINVD